MVMVMVKVALNLMEKTNAYRHEVGRMYIAPQVSHTTIIQSQSHTDRELGSGDRIA